MGLIVHKYGGTSMGSTERIRNVARRVAKWARAGHRMVVVPSAMSGETNRLLALAKELSPARADAASMRELDQIAATGEQVSVGLLALALQAEGVPAVSYTGWQVPVATDSAHTKARIESIDDRRVRADLDAGRVVIITGFQGIDGRGNVTTLGRGGSDTSAVAVGGGAEGRRMPDLHRRGRRLYGNPRIVLEARRLHAVSFEEMLEMAASAPSVLQIRFGGVACRTDVCMRVLSSFTDWDIPARRRGPLVHADHSRGRRKDGTSRRVRHRLFPRRSQDHRHRRARQAGHRRDPWARWPTPTSTST